MLSSYELSYQRISRQSNPLISIYRIMKYYSYHDTNLHWVSIRMRENVHSPHVKHQLVISELLVPPIPPIMVPYHLLDLPNTLTSSPAPTPNKPFILRLVSCPIHRLFRLSVNGNKASMSVICLCIFYCHTRFSSG